MTDKGKVLLVDDQPENIAVLYSTIHRQGYDVLVANDGESALESVAESPPELILLDVMMPGMNGFEVCRVLKAKPETQDIPVVFMTALADTANKLEGFTAGGVDYITKPFEQTEVLARIRAHLGMYRLQQELRAKNIELEERNAELDAFAHTVAHDLKNPLGVIGGFAHVLGDLCGGCLDDEGMRMLSMMQRQVSRARDIIEALLLMAGTSRHSAVSIEPIQMGDLVSRLRERFALQLAECGGELLLPERWPVAQGYPIWVEEIWANYISNAIKYGGTPPRIELGADEQAEWVRCWVQDNGEGLAPEQQARLFTPFTRLHRERAEGHGLGLSIVQRISSRMGGEAGVESTMGRGSRFWFTLPSQPAADLSPGHSGHDISGVRLVNGRIVFD